mgnify:CR=1 FL=1
MVEKHHACLVHLMASDLFANINTLVFRDIQRRNKHEYKPTDAAAGHTLFLSLIHI